MVVNATTAERAIYEDRNVRYGSGRGNSLDGIDKVSGSACAEKDWQSAKRGGFFVGHFRSTREEYAGQLRGKHFLA